MRWSPEPFPSMDQFEYDDLARQFRAAGGRWPEGMPALVVDDQHNLIDGYKRQHVASDLGIKTCHAYVLETAGMSDEERAEKYTLLRTALNNHTVLTDEIDAWLKELRQ